MRKVNRPLKENRNAKVMVMLKAYFDIFADYQCSIEPITLSSGKLVDVTKRHFAFKCWNGDSIADSYRKPVLDWHGAPIFAELIIVQLLRRHQFDGVWWVDNFRRRFRQSMEAFLLPLEPIQKAALKDRESKHSLPPLVRDLYEKLVKANGCRKGFWDILAWNQTEVLFAECKWKGHDSINHDQQRGLKQRENSREMSATF